MISGCSLNKQVATTLYEGHRQIRKEQLDLVGKLVRGEPLPTYTENDLKLRQAAQDEIDAYYRKIMAQTSVRP